MCECIKVARATAAAILYWLSDFEGATSTVERAWKHLVEITIPSQVKNTKTIIYSMLIHTHSLESLIHLTCVSSDSGWKPKQARRHFKNQNIEVPFYQTVKWQFWHRDTTPSTYSTYPEGLRRLCHTSTKSLTTVMLPHICHPGWGCLMLQAVTVLSEGGLRSEGE